MSSKRIAIISTGGTIEKTYDQLAGVLSNRVSVLDVMLTKLELGNIEIVRLPLMNKDSTDMNEADHRLIARTAMSMAEAHDGVIIVHGTDTLTVTGETCVELIPELQVPIILTGAMRPYALRTTDAMQNLTEALLAVQLLSAGVYVVMQNTVLQFPGVIKDRENQRFIKP